MLFLALLYTLDARASPVFQGDTNLGLASTSDLTNTSPCQTLNPSRSFLRILWTCMTIIVSCTWIAVHPNIPASSDSLWTVLRRRCKFMLCSLITPGLMLVWTIRQWIGAKHIAAKYKGMLPLLHLDLRLLSAGSIDWPSASVQEIEDKSKDSNLAKALVVLQTTIFVAKCITRLIRGEFLAQLEVLCLAFACLNATMYGLWWDKPLDVRSPIPVILHEQEATPQTSGEEPIELRDLDSSGRAPPERSLPGTAVLASNMYRPFKSFLQPFSDMVYTHNLPNNKTHVPSFYAYDPSESGTGNQTVPVLVSTLISVIFGGVHCLLWIFPPRSAAFLPGAAPVLPVELCLWRIGSLIVTVIPLLFLALCAYLTGLPLRFVPLSEWLSGRLPRQPESQKKGATKIDKVYATLCVLCFLYTVCRIALFALAFAELRVFVPRDVGWKSAFDWYISRTT
ncbi:hypothetical protein BD779DRAFT_1707834 [Infundibulicybe gibba]|nr:hypothetical protein BD779DRAFT_1707834 [Infundibulicybe gibba]